MKRMGIWLLALLLLGGCAPAAEAPVQTEAPVLTAEAQGALTDILTDMAENYHPGSAGCSLTAARLAGALLDWQAENAPEPAAVEAAAAAFYAGLSGEKQAALPELIGGVYGAAGGLTADWLESSGYTPQHFPWAQADIDALFAALQSGMGLDMPGAATF